jgi:4-amino-4-deoxy-L-arabinose transferase-like glycosyltransferase
MREYIAAQYKGESDRVLSADSRAAVIVLICIALGSVVRVAFAAGVGLGIDESYTVGLARHLALSYFDHPPLHVWLVGLWARLCGSENALLLRLPFIALFAGSTWLMFALTARLFDARAGLWAAIAFNLPPEFAVSAGSWILPDGPLVFFLLAAACVLASIVLKPPARDLALLQWLAAGALGGLALLSKYTAVFLFAGVLLFLLTTPAVRRWLATPGPWVAAAVVAVIFLPVLWWNIEHDWVSFAFQSGRGRPDAFNINWVLQYLGGQLAYLLPWILIPLAVVLWRALARGPVDAASWFCACLAVLPIALFTLAAFWSRALPHWPAPGWLFALPLLGTACAQLARTHQGALWRSAIATALLDVLLMVLVATHVATGWVARAAPVLVESRDPTLDLLDWSDLKGELAKRGLLRHDLFLAGINWTNSGKLNYALGRNMSVLCLCGLPHQFALDDDPAAWRGRDGIIVGTGDQFAVMMPFLATLFERVELLPPMTLTRAGTPALQLSLARGIGFKANVPGS